MSKIYLSWEDVEHLVGELCKQIQVRRKWTPYSPFKRVHGLQRGGFIPAVMISHKLNIPYADDPTRWGDECLIIDDICDSGETLEAWTDHVTAVLHHKPHTACVTPTMYGKLHKGDEWIIYPWEAKNSKTIQDYKLDN